MGIAMFELVIRRGALCRESGPPTAPILLLLHGFADSGAMFGPLFLTPLVEQYRLLAIDLPGFGVSPRREGKIGVVAYSEALDELCSDLGSSRPIGLVAHSVASMIAVETAARRLNQLMGIFSIEGNLTADDAYFSGKASGFDDPDAFKHALLDEIWGLAAKQPMLRRYHGGVVMADPIAMWNLGRDAKRLSASDAAGRAFNAITIPKLYYWSPNNTPLATQRWLNEHQPPQRQFGNASHWPTIDQPEYTARAISDFFDNSRT
jgi:pimeloyl-ACP methyl ester carboxylesterase